MYPVLKIMHMLNFLDTFSMGITTTCFTILFSKSAMYFILIEWTYPSDACLYKLALKCLNLLVKALDNIADRSTIFNALVVKI